MLSNPCRTGRRGANGRLFAYALSLALTACGTEGAGPESEAPTDSVCPSGSTLSYESFGQAFMQRYCTQCHSSTVSGSARRGAPSDHNFDSLDAIKRAHPPHIDARAAAGPSAVNTSMPPSGIQPRPSEAERRQLGEWLACGLP